MNTVKRDRILFGPFVSQLTGERRQAYFRQYRITLVLTILSVVLAELLAQKVLVTGNYTAFINDRSVFGVIIFGGLCIQFVCALIKRETIWQLYFREKWAREQEQAQRLIELQKFGKELDAQYDSRSTEEV